MNKVHKVIWSKVRGCNVVVSELAKGHSGGSKRVRGKAACAAAACVALMLMPNAAWAADHTATLTDSDTASSVTVTIADGSTDTFGVFASDRDITIGNSASPGNISVTIGNEKTPIIGSDSSDSSATYAANGKSLTIYGSDVTLGMYTNGGLATGIINDGTNTIKADSLDISASAADMAFGIYNTGENTIEATESVSITAESANNWAYGIYVPGGENNIASAAMTISTDSSGRAYGINDCNDAISNIKVDALSITATSTNEQALAVATYHDATTNIEADSVSIAAASAAFGQAVGMGTYHDATTNIETNSLDISASAADMAFGIYNTGENTIEATESVSITAESANNWAYGIYVPGGENNIASAAMTISTDSSGRAYGINDCNDAVSNINVDSLSITAISSDEQALAVATYHDATTNIEADSISLTADSTADRSRAVTTYQNGTTNIKATTVNITASSDGGRAQAVRTYGGTTTIDADIIKINSTSTASAEAESTELARGVEAGDNEDAEYTSSTILGNENSDISVNVASANNGTRGIAAVYEGASVTVNGESLEVNATGCKAIGIYVSNGTREKTAPANAAQVTINSQNTTVNSDDIGLAAYNNGQMDINGNLTVEASKAIEARGNSTININESGNNTVALTGNIVFETSTNESENTVNANLNLNLTDADSSWTGNAYKAYPVDENGATQVDTDVTGFKMTLSNGAVWNVTDISDKYADYTTTITTTTTNEDGTTAETSTEATIHPEKLAINELTSDGGVISLTEGGTAAINTINMDGDLTVNVADNGGELEYTTMAGTGGLTKTGDGTLTLATDTAYTGATTVEGGILYVGEIETAFTTLNISNAAFVTDIDRSFTDVTFADGTYNGKVASDGGTVTSSGTSAITGDLTLDSATLTVSDGTLTADTLNASSSTISNSGTISVTDATLSNTTYTGGGALTASGSVTATDSDITGNLEAETATFADSTVDGTVTAATLTTSGTSTITDSVTASTINVSDTLYLTGGTVSGVLNIASNSSAYLKGAAYTAYSFEDTLTGDGKLVVSDKGMLITTSDQVFTEAAGPTSTDAEAINDIASAKVTFNSGTLQLDDEEYTYDYVVSALGLIQKSGDTSLTMTGTLVDNTEIDTDETGAITADQASALGDAATLDTVSVVSDGSLIIGVSAIDEGTEIHDVVVDDAVANGFSADALRIDGGGSNASHGVVITNNQSLTLGGSNGNDNLVYVKDSSVPVTVVVGTDLSETEEAAIGIMSNHATFTIGNGVATDATAVSYTLNGSILVNEGSSLNVNGQTSVTDTVTLSGATLAVTDDGSTLSTTKLEASGNGKLSGTVETQTLTVSSENASDTVIKVGNSYKAGRLTVGNADLNGAKIYLDPVWNGGTVEDGTYYGQDGSEINGLFTVSNNSIASFGSIDADTAYDRFNDTGYTWGSEITAAAYIATSQTFASGTGTLVIDGSAAGASSAAAGTFNAAANSLLMVEADAAASEASPAISNIDTDFTIDSEAKLYINGASENSTYYVFGGDAVTDPTTAYADENISADNRLLEITASAATAGAYEASGYTSASDVYDGLIVIPDIVDQAVQANDGSAASEFFTDAVNRNVYASDEASAKAINSVANMGELGGVNHGTYSMSNAMTDAVTEHLSLATHGEQDKDIWVHYIHNKEDIDGMDLGGMDGNYKAQYNGIVIGSDFYKKGKATAGVALSYADGNIYSSSSVAYTKNDAEYYGASIYGRIDNGKSAILGDISYIHSDNDITQTNTGREISASADADAFSVGIRAEQAIKAGAGNIVPYAGLRYMRVGTGNYSNSLGMRYDTDDQNLVLLPVGITYSAEVQSGDWTIRPIAEAGYVWTMGDRDTDVSVGLNGAADTFGFETADSGSFIGRLGIQAEKANVTYGMSYRYQKGDSVKANKWMANLIFSF